MQKAAHKSSFIVLVRDLNGGRVRLLQGGKPLIDYRPGGQEQKFLRQGIANAVRLHLAAGANKIMTLHTREHSLSRSSSLSQAEIEDFCRKVAREPVSKNWSILFSAHQMGTCRMGRDRRTAVCDCRGQVFGVEGLFIADGSAFPRSCGVNPMVTIMAMAHHTAQRMKEG